MADEPSRLLGPDGEPITPPEVPAWALALRRDQRVNIAGWWFRIEDPVTNGEGQWALILSPVEPTGATRRAEKEAERAACRHRRK